MFLCCSDSLLSGMNIFDSLFILLLLLYYFSLFALLYNHRKFQQQTKNTLSDSESQLFSIMVLPHINRAHVGCVFMLLSLLCLTARSLGDLYLYVVYFVFSLMNEVENIKWFQTSYRTFVSHWTNVICMKDISWINYVSSIYDEYIQQELIPRQIVKGLTGPFYAVPQIILYLF